MVSFLDTMALIGLSLETTKYMTECKNGACSLPKKRQLTIETDGNKFDITKNELGNLELLTILQMIFNRINK